MADTRTASQQTDDLAVTNDFDGILLPKKANRTMTSTDNTRSRALRANAIKAARRAALDPTTSKEDRELALAFLRYENAGLSDDPRLAAMRSGLAGTDDQPYRQGSSVVFPAAGTPKR